MEISLKKYLGDETINKYVEQVDDLDRAGAENEASLWRDELKKLIIPRFNSVNSTFSREIVINAAESYFRDNVPLIGKMVAGIKAKDALRMQNAPREIYLDLLGKFLEAYFNKNFVASFSQVKMIDAGRALDKTNELKKILEKEFMEKFDGVKFNSFDEESVFLETEEKVLEELKK